MKSGNKAFIWLFLFLLVASLLLLLAFKTPGKDRWEEAKNRVNRLKLETKLRKVPRSELNRKLVPGNAWEEYSLAINEMMSRNDDETGGIYASFANGGGADRKKVLKLVADRASALEHLRRAVERTDGQYPYNWDAGWHGELPSLLGIRKLANLAIAQASILAQNGKPGEAADLLLDTTVFAKDVATNGVLLTDLIGIAVYEVAFNEFKHLITSGKLSKQELEDLASKLERVERDMPDMRTPMANETMLFGIGMEDAVNAGGKEWLDLIKSDWGMLFSARTKFADAYDEKEGYLRRVEKLHEMGFLGATKEASAIDVAARTSSSSLVRQSTPEVSRMDVVHRETLTQVRLLRAAAAYLATGKVPDLADPFGDKLHSREEGGKMKIWSAGKDGRSQNGAGNWDPGKPDIVIEVPSPTH